MGPYGLVKYRWYGKDREVLQAVRVEYVTSNTHPDEVLARDMTYEEATAMLKLVDQTTYKLGEKR